MSPIEEKYLLVKVLMRNQLLDNSSRFDVYVSKSLKKFEEAMAVCLKEPRFTQHREYLDHLTSSLKIKETQVLFKRGSERARCLLIGWLIYDCLAPTLRKALRLAVVGKCEGDSKWTLRFGKGERTVRRDLSLDAGIYSETPRVFLKAHARLACRRD